MYIPTRSTAGSNTIVIGVPTLPGDGVSFWLNSELGSDCVVRPNPSVEIAVGLLSGTSRNVTPLDAYCVVTSVPDGTSSNATTVGSANEVGPTGSHATR